MTLNGNTNENLRLDFIQALRGVAALMVVLCHARWFLLGTPSQDLAEWILAPGGAGVDIFFVISGFVMVYSTRRSTGTLQYATEFFAKRLLKIWIPYAVVGLIYFYTMHGASAFTMQDLVQIAKSLCFIPTDVTSLFYYGKGLIPVAWSLNYEFYFYLVLSASLIFGKLRWVAFGLWMFFFVYALPVYDRGYFSTLPMSSIDSRSAYLQMMTNPIILEFIAGIVIGFIYLSPIRIRNIAASRVAVMLAIGLGIWSWATHFRNLNSIYYYGIFASFLVLALAVASKTKDIQVPKVLIWLGNISYSLYLVHLLVNRTIETIFQRNELGGLVHTWGHVILTTCTSITVAAASHYLLETVIHDRVKANVINAIRKHFNSRNPSKKITTAKVS
jgi:exopolysaccharide production protein ExoZ